MMMHGQNHIKFILDSFNRRLQALDCIEFCSTWSNKATTHWHARMP